VKGLRFAAGTSLAVLFAINMANYMDRYLVIALQEPIKETFKVSDTQIGLLTSAFVLVYMCVSPLCGWLADRIQRRYVVSMAVGLWSLATAAASRAFTFNLLLGLRGTVGVGEAGYNAAGQALLTDLFPEDKRNKVMAIFNLAMPVGSAVGFLLAGALLKHFGDWRMACLVVGAPGMLLALLALGLPAGVTGPASVDSHGNPIAPGDHGSTLEAYGTLVRDPVFMTNTLGFAMQSFALGALVAWSAAFLHRHHQMEVNEADKLTGYIAAGSGLVGTALGMFLADFFAKRSRIPAYALVTGVGYLLAAPLLAVGLFLPLNASLACLFVSMVGAFLGIGPQNAIVAARAPVLHRATAFAFVVVVLHLLGDAASPPLLGAVSTHFQENGLAEGEALQRALVVAPAALVVGALFMFACAWLAREKPKAA
jgi:MFS family permease